MAQALAFNRLLPDRPKDPTVSDLRLKYPVNILVAYPYFDRSVIALLESQPKGSFRLLIDSGAFTAHASGKPIVHQDYLNFLKSLRHLGELNAVQLDVIGNPEATHKNLMVAYDQGCHVMPVFTRGERPDRLEEFYNLSPYILLGGVAKGQLNVNYVTWFQKENRGRPVHWLGFTRMPFVRHHRPTSVDSSSWISVARYGMTFFYNGRGELIRYTRKDAHQPPDLKIVKAAARVGLSRHELGLLAKSDAWVSNRTTLLKELSEGGQLTARGAGIFVSSLSFTKMALECEAHLGTRYYLAGTQAMDLLHVFAARDFMIARNILN